MSPHSRPMDEGVELKLSGRRGGRRRLVLPAVLAGLLLSALAGVAVPSYRNTMMPAGVVIHHTAVPLPPGGRPLDVRVLDEIHRRRGYGIFYWGRFYHVGYHYLILPDGTVQSGRPERCQGAHAVGYNHYIGVCLVGDFSAPDDLHDRNGPREPTAAQMQALVELTARLRARYGLPLERMIQHREVNPNTQCPGERFPFEELMQRLRERGS